jgi:hypothetical protein
VKLDKGESLTLEHVGRTDSEAADLTHYEYHRRPTVRVLRWYRRQGEIETRLLEDGADLLLAELRGPK